MEPILYNAVNGGHSNFKRQEITANNLANVNTTGFKADLYQAKTMYATSSDGSNSNQSFNIQSPNGIDLTPGDVITTGRNLDLAIEGDGWFAVHDSQGQEAYTRAGSLHLNSINQLITASGKLVLGNGGPISIPPVSSLSVGIDGTISIVPLGGDPKTPAVLDRIKLVTVDKKNLVKDTEGLLQLTTGSSKPADNTVRVHSGALEGSNVKAIDQMVAMITSGREFDSHMKLMSTVDDNYQKLAQVLHE